MAGYLSGYVKPDLVLGPTTITTVLYSNYIDMAKYDKVIFIGQSGTMSSTEGIEMSLHQAKSSTGSGSVALGAYSTINGTPGVLGQVTKVLECVLLGSSEAVTEGDYWTINGLTYTVDCSSDSGYTTGSFNATRTVVGSTNTAAAHSSEPSRAIAHLAAYINHPEYGVPGVTAVVSAASSYVTLYANDHIGEAAITCLSAAGDTTIYINKAIGSVECDSAELASSSNYNFVALQSSANGAEVVHYSVMAIRSVARYSPNATDLMAYAFGV